MKSQTFLRISTLILGASILAGGAKLATPVYADDISASAVDSSLLPVGTEINGKRYWSVAEMQTASDLISSKREEFCQGDRICQEELPWQQMDELGGIYRALDPFEHIHFALTAINPSKDTFKVLYHDEDKMLSRMLGETVRHGIASIYAVWVDESLGSITTTSSNWLAYGQRAPYHLGSVEEVEAATHPLFDESETELGPGWFTPNVEREYHVEGSNLAANTTGQIHFSLVDTAGGHSHGTLNYASCIKSPSYTVGMDCTMMYAEDGSYAYLPFIPASESTTPVEPSEPESQPKEPTIPEPTTPDNSTVTPDQPSTESTRTSNEPSTQIQERIIYVTVSNPETPRETLSVSIPREGIATATTGTQVAMISSNSSPENKDQTEESSTAGLASNPTDTIEIPLAATPAAKGEDEHVFPWWLIVLMFFGTAFIIFSWWFLLPLFKRKNDDEE